MNPNFLILYVTDPLASAAFYSGLFSKPVLESAPTFSMLPINETVMLGLWKSGGVEPAANRPGGMEIAVTLPTNQAVDDTFADWKTRKVTMLTEPFDLDFGHSFVAEDPDGHRIRVFAPRADA